MNFTTCISVSSGNFAVACRVFGDISVFVPLLMVVW